MASQTRPLLMTGAALASAATLVAATPAIAPSLNQAAVTVANGDYNLATFSDIFTVPSSVWINTLFAFDGGGWGGAVGPDNNPAVQPWADVCSGQCLVGGLSGVAYLALDALINGDGTGYENSANWTVSAVNYFFEGGSDRAFNAAGLGGLGAGVEYLLQTSIGAGNPVLATVIALLFTGTDLISIAYQDAIGILADAALSLPVLGQYVYGSLNAYLGIFSKVEAYQDYFPGPTGVLNYFIDVITGNAPPPPEAAPEAAAAVPAAAATALVSAAAAPAAEADAPVESEAVVPAADEAVGVTAVEDAAETEISEPVAAGSAGAEASAGTEAEEAAPAETAAEADAEAVAAESAEADANPAADAGTGAVANPRETATDTRSEAQASDNPVKSRKRPIRDAVEKVGNAIGSALKGSKATASTTAGATAGAGEAESSS